MVGMDVVQAGHAVGSVEGRAPAAYARCVTAPRCARCSASDWRCAQAAATWGGGRFASYPAPRAPRPPPCGVHSRVAAFLDVYQELKTEILERVLPSYSLPAGAKEYMAEVMDYNVPGGKLNRGLTVVHIMQTIRGDALTAEEVKLASVLGWCIEWVRALCSNGGDGDGGGRR
ncbi:hypothetical protein EON62_04480 [archaeon]|nr:MAG: hypothetical protein EON62_04480 [archaeon]